MHHEADTQARLDEGDARMTTLEDQVAELRRELSINTAITQDIRDVLESLRALFRLGRWAARVGAWFAPIAAAMAAWVAVFHGKKP